MECGVLWSGRLAILTGTDTRATGTGQWSWYWHSCWYWPNVIPSGTGNGTSTNTRTGTLFFLYFEHGMCCLLSGHLGNISNITDISDIVLHCCWPAQGWERQGGEGLTTLSLSPSSGPDIMFLKPIWKYNYAISARFHHFIRRQTLGSWGKYTRHFYQASVQKTLF